VGSINSSTGLYNAPGATGTATIQASTGGVSGNAGVSVIAQSATTATLTAGAVSYHRRYALATLTVQITPPSGAALPTGTVELFYNGSVLASTTIQIVNGVALAQFTVQFTANGTYAFTAEYLGSSSFEASTSNTVAVVV
jgi:hypothetical protein